MSRKAENKHPDWLSSTQYADTSLHGPPPNAGSQVWCNGWHVPRCCCAWDAFALTENGVHNSNVERLASQ